MLGMIFFKKGVCFSDQILLNKFEYVFFLIFNYNMKELVVLLVLKVINNVEGSVLKY